MKETELVKPTLISKKVSNRGYTLMAQEGRSFIWIKRNMGCGRFLLDSRKHREDSETWYDTESFKVVIGWLRTAETLDDGKGPGKKMTGEIVCREVK